MPDTPAETPPRRFRPPGDGSGVEVPSGKHGGYENFPVGSALLPAHLRPHIITFYNFARAIDDIADTPALPPEEKIRRLEGFAEVLRTGALTPGYEKAAAMAESLTATGVTREHCLDLVAAFRQDASQNRYHSWDSLMAYCMLSAAPVGRYLVDLHGGLKGNGKGDGKAGGVIAYSASDALCCALQVINHVQDCADDYRTLDRVYLPAEWMAAAGAAPSDLENRTTSKELRAVLDRVLDATAALLVFSRCLPGQLHSRRLAMEAAVIQRIAEALVSKLRREDPLAGRVSLGRVQNVVCGVRGVLAALFSPRNSASRA